MSTLRGVKLNVGGELEVVCMPNKLEAFQHHVGGLIEIPYIFKPLADRGIVCVINEEGKLLNLEPTVLLVHEGELVDVVVGNALFFKDAPDGEFGSLSEDDIKFVMKFLLTDFGHCIRDGQMVRISKVEV